MGKKGLNPPLRPIHPSYTYIQSMFYVHFDAVELRAE